MTINEAWVRSWANTYDESYDQTIREVAHKSAPTFDDLRTIVRWKSARSTGYFNRNEPEDAESTAKRSLVADEQSALDMLCSLHGVGPRVASAILAALAPDRYTVMDVRTWATLTAHGHLKKEQGLSWRRAWVPYLSVCRELAERVGVDLRTLDRALYRAKGSTGTPGRETE